MLVVVGASGGRRAPQATEDDRPGIMALPTNLHLCCSRLEPRQRHLEKERGLLVQRCCTRRRAGRGGFQREGLKTHMRARHRTFSASSFVALAVHVKQLTVALHMSDMPGSR